jgi:hypothetical protein
VDAMIAPAKIKIAFRIAGLLCRICRRFYLH